MRKLGCLVVLVLLVVAAFLAYKGGWVRFGREPASDRASASLGTWQPLSPAGAARAKAAVERLNSPSGPVYVNVAPGDLAAYIFQELSHFFPGTADSIQAAAIGDRLYVRAIVATKDLGGSGALGPLAALLGDRERVQLGGMLRIVKPGFAELQVKEVKIGNLTLPQPLIPKVISRISPRDRPPELADDGLPLRTPMFIGDVRVSNGQVTLYRTAPAK